MYVLNFAIGNYFLLQTVEVLSVKSFWFDFIGNSLAFQCSHSIFYHPLHHPSCCSVGVGANVGGDQHIRKAKERMIPAQDGEEEL